MCDQTTLAKNTVNIAIIGEYSPQFEPHQKTNEAISHSAELLGVDVVSEWISTSDISEKAVSRYSAFWIAPGSPYQNMAATLDLIRLCRVECIPCFGTCGGFQHMVLEFAKNGLGISDAQHAEYDPYASRLIVARLDCSLVGRELEIALMPESKTSGIYKKEKVFERYYCNFGVNPEYLIPLNKTEIPKTSIGKIQRTQLTKRFANGEFNSILKENADNLKK